MSIISLSGLARSGKSTAANYLVAKRGCVRVKFADPLKTMLRSIGLSDDEIEGDRKEKPCELLVGITPRRAMQTLGAEWGRGCIHDDLWTSFWARTVSDVTDHGGHVVSDDMRFPNEAKIVKAMGGLVVRVVRENGGIGGDHVSEMQTFPADIEITNDGTLDEFFEKIDRLADVALRPHLEAIPSL